MKDALNLTEQYCEIARTLVGSEHVNIQHGVCPDQGVGSIGDFDGNAEDFPMRQPVTRLDDLPCVVLVMESPHIHEFIENWGPAKGKTGTRIRKYIGAIVTGLGSQLSDLILINAIQYQCSLGLPTHRYRDRVFKSLWETGGAVDFKQRLKLIYRPQDMLLNCCTGTEPLVGRRQLVTAAIRNSLGSVALYSGPHPFSWISEPNRMAVRLL